MKELLLFLLIFAAFGDSLFAQDTVGNRQMMVNVRIITIDRQVRNGYLFAVGDTSLLLSGEKRFPPVDDSLRLTGLRTYGYREMSHIEIYHKGKTWRAPLLGLAIGGSIGALSGFLSGDDPSNQWFALSASDKAIGLGILGGGLGLIIGFCVGVASHHTFYIGGDHKRYERMRQKTLARLGI